MGRGVRSPSRPRVVPRRLREPCGEERDEPRAWDALEEARTRAERGAISISLQQASKNVTEAAKQLGVSRMTLYRLMAKHGIGHELRG